MEQRQKVYIFIDCETPQGMFVEDVFGTLDGLREALLSRNLDGLIDYDDYEQSAQDAVRDWDGHGTLMLSTETGEVQYQVETRELL